MQAEGPDVGSILTIWDDVSESEMRTLKVSGIPQANHRRKEAAIRDRVDGMDEYREGERERSGRKQV